MYSETGLVDSDGTDSCACHIHYEWWVQMQWHLNQILIQPDLAAQLFNEAEGSNVREYLKRQNCRKADRITNKVEWSLVPAASDCVPGHMTLYTSVSRKFYFRRKELHKTDHHGNFFWRRRFSLSHGGADFRSHTAAYSDSN